MGYNQSLVLRDDRSPGNWLQKLTGRKFQFPTVFIAGAQKSGTTSLAAALATHPDVATPELKEPFYYGNDIRFERGKDFFLGNFPDQNRKLTFDASTNYLDHPLAAERIKRDVPNAKIILILRDPVERAFSHYKMQVRNKIEQLSFEDALLKEEERIAEGNKISPMHNYCYQRLGYRTRGEYSRMITPWLTTFSADQILILIAEEYFSDTPAHFRNMLQFLDLSDFVPESFEAMNTGSKELMNAGTREMLAVHYAPFNLRLADLLGRNINWTKP